VIQIHIAFINIKIYMKNDLRLDNSEERMLLISLMNRKLCLDNTSINTTHLNETQIVVGYGIIFQFI
jgi:hypothetical protein